MRQGFRRLTPQDELRFDGARPEETHGPAASLGRIEGVRTENAERISIARDEERLQASPEVVRRRRFWNRRIWVRHESILTEEPGRTNGLKKKNFSEMGEGAQ
jgi:hypothetical protein